MTNEATRCPGGLGGTDNGHDGRIQPNAYYCTNCMVWLDGRGEFLRSAAGIDTNFDLIDKNINPSEMNMDRWVDIFARYYCRLIVDDLIEWTNENVGLMDEEVRADLYKRYGIGKGLY